TNRFATLPVVRASRLPPQIAPSRIARIPIKTLASRCCTGFGTGTPGSVTMTQRCHGLPSEPGGHAVLPAGLPPRSRCRKRRKTSKARQGSSKAGSSVVLPDVTEGLLKHVVVADLELDVQRVPERLADLLVTTDRGLPAVEPYGLHDLVDPVD